MSGYATKTAVRRPAETSDWGTQATGVDNIVPFVSEGLKDDLERSTIEAVHGKAGVVDSDVAGHKVGGPLSIEAWFEGLEYIFLAAFGFECPSLFSGAFKAVGAAGGSPAPDTASSPNAFIHLFELDDNLHREAWASGERDASSGSSSDPEYWTASDQKVRALTIDVHKGLVTNPHRFVDMMAKNLSIKITPGSVTIDADWIGHSRVLGVAPTSTTWSLPDNLKRALFPNLVFSMGPASDAASTVIPVAELTIDIDNKLDGGFVSGTSELTQGDGFIEEPARTGIRKISIKGKLSRYTTANLLFDAFYQAGLELQAQASLIGGLVPGQSTYNFRSDFVLPKCKLVKFDAPIGGPGAISGDFEIEAEIPDTSAYDRTWIRALTGHVNGSGPYTGGINMIKKNEMFLRLINSRAACFSRDRQAAGVTLP